MLVTIFTPTYNRAYILPNLYNSILRQTDKRFEWIIVDDGSTDATKGLVMMWQKEDRVHIKYFLQENGGKHRAINRGVKEACGDLFFIMDSDDYMSDNAVELLITHYNSIKDDPTYAGVSGIRCFQDGTRIGGERNFGLLDCSSIEFRMKYNFKGDMGEALKTEVLRKYPFPEIEGEKFCPEAVMFNRVALHYKIRYFYACVCFCEYLSDGLTAQIIKLRMHSPKASMICYSELSKCPIPFLQKTKAIINYWRFYFCGNETLCEGLNKISKWGIILIPIGWLMHINDLRYDT